jgi:hypothetical protein
VEDLTHQTFHIHPSQALAKADGMHHSFEDDSEYSDPTPLKKTAFVDEKERKPYSVTMVLILDEV